MRKKLIFDVGFCVRKRKNIEVKLYEKSKIEEIRLVMVVDIEGEL